MNEERMRVLELLAAGTINVVQATQLLEALSDGSERQQPPPAPAATEWTPHWSGRPAPAPTNTNTNSNTNMDGGPRRGRPRMRLDDLAGLKSMGVTAEYVRTMRELGVTGGSADEFSGMAAVGVTPEYVAALRDAGLTITDGGELTGLRAVGVTPEYVAALRDAGLTELDAGELTSMFAAGVTAEYAAEIVEVGLIDFSAEVLAALPLDKAIPPFPFAGETRSLEH